MNTADEEGKLSHGAVGEDAPLEPGLQFEESGRGFVGRVGVDHCYRS